jgi:hypothetical protein
MNNTIIEELNRLIPIGANLYESAIIAKNRQALKEDIHERTKRQISIVMSNYQQALEQSLLSNAVSTEIYQGIVSKSDEILSEMASDIENDLEKDKGNIEQLFEYINFKFSDGSITSPITDTFILLAIKEFMPKYQAILDECLENIWSDIIEFDNDHEGNMNSLEEELDYLDIPDLNLDTCI